jgi:hypothetical protein
MINDETPEFRQANLPPNVSEADLEVFIADQVKNKRSHFAQSLKEGVGVESEPIPVPNLWTLVANVYSSMDSSFKRVGPEKIHSNQRISQGSKV